MPHATLELILDLVGLYSCVPVMFCPNTINIISYHRKKSIVLLNPGARVLDDSLLVHGLTGRFRFRIIVSKPTRPDGYLETLEDPEAQTTSTMKDSL
jgi:hypothetical protein